MPPAIAAAGISAAGSVAGAAIGGKGAKKVAKIQAKTAEQQMAQTKLFYDNAVTRYQGDINQADKARDLYAGLLGDGGDPAAAHAAYDTWKNSAGYQNSYDEALRGVNSNAYASGMGRSGAALKALQIKAGDVANNYFQTYMSNVDRQVQTGANAKSAITGAGTNALAANNAAMQSSADATSNAQLAASSGWANAFKNIGNAAANAYQSSYGNKGGGS